MLIDIHCKFTPNTNLFIEICDYTELFSSILNIFLLFLLLIILFVNKLQNTFSSPELSFYGI